MDESKQTGSRMAAEGSGSSSMACGAVHRQTLKAGSRCVNSARRDLCGGYPVTGIPTATLFGLYKKQYQERKKEAFWGTYGTKMSVLGHSGAWLGHCDTYELCRIMYDVIF